MERLMKAQSVGDAASMEFMRGRRVFEINPQHPIIQTLNAAYNTNSNDEEALRAINLLFDTALISSGFTPESPSQLGGKIYEMMSAALSGKWTTPAAQYQETASPQQNNNSEPLEAEIVETVKAGGQK